MLARRGDGRVEALEMSGLHDASVFAAQLENAVGIGEAGGERFFDQKIETCGEKRRCSGSVMHGGHADRGSIERACCRQTLLDGREAGYAELCCGFGGDGWVAVDDGGKLDRLTCLFELTIDAKMVAPEGSRSNNGDAKWMRAGHYFFSVRFSIRDSTGASTTWRQRA